MDGENHGKPYFLMDELGGNPLFLETPILRLADAGRGHHCHGEQRYRTGGFQTVCFFREGLREVALLRGGKMKLPDFCGRINAKIHGNHYHWMICPECFANRFDRLLTQQTKQTLF